MLWVLLSKRWFQGSIVFCVLCVMGSLLYSWHVDRATDREMARHDRFLQERREKQNTTRPVKSVEAPTENETPGVVNTPEENTDTQMPELTEALPNETDDLVDAFLPEDFVSEVEAPAEEVPVSPFGFGPYPEVPSDFPKAVIWQGSEEKRQKFADDGRLEDMELIDRVLIKLWNQGDHEWRGAKRDDLNGKVYPLYRNRIYVKHWIEIPVEGGQIMPFPAGGTSGGSDWKPDRYLPIFYESGGQLPDHIQFIDQDAAGYDPYTFLNLQ